MSYRRTCYGWQYGVCALHAVYLRLYIHTQNTKYFFFFCNNGYPKAPKSYVIRNLPILPFLKCVCVRARARLCVLRHCQLLCSYSVDDRWMKHYRTVVEWYWQGKTEALGQKHVQGPFFSYHKSHVDRPGSNPVFRSERLEVNCL
jgi:hypothetical protein